MFGYWENYFSMVLWKMVEWRCLSIVCIILLYTIVYHFYNFIPVFDFMPYTQFSAPYIMLFLEKVAITIKIYLIFLILSMLTPIDDIGPFCHGTPCFMHCIGGKVSTIGKKLPSLIVKRVKELAQLLLILPKTAQTNVEYRTVQLITGSEEMCANKPTVMSPSAKRAHKRS